MVCHKLAPMTSSKTTTQGSYTYKWRMSQWFPMNNRVVLANWIIITSALATHVSHLCAKCVSNGSCCCWKFLRQFARPDAHWLLYTSRFSACGTALQGHTKRFWPRCIPVCLCLLTKLVGTLLWENLAAFQSLQLLSSPNMRAKMLHVALQ